MHNQIDMYVSYDIADPKRLVKTGKVVLDYGVRVQKSKYMVRLPPQLIIHLKSRIEDIIEPAHDGVKYVPLCERCCHGIEIIGQGKKVPEDQTYYIF